ncbi:MAG: AcrR family transcriptional regulator [Halioglobus sp.]|jgi:AcrR family transcriptional regulator
MSTKKEAAPKSKSGGDISWQAQKSAMTRDRILDAAINCFVELGYTHVTTAKVASSAGVSRGAMLHHFPSKTELIQAAVEYLHDKLLEDYTARVEGIADSLKGKERRRAGLDAYWDHLTGDYFVVHHELSVASRTDPELKSILENSQQLFETHVRESNTDLFAEWQDRGDRFLLAMDVTKFMMEGMAAGQLMTNRDERVSRLLGYLADRLEEIFDEGEEGSAIGRHSALSNNDNS